MMTEPLTEVESDAVHAASLALPPRQRAEFRQRVAAELKSLPCGVLGPGTIAACQQSFLRSGARVLDL